MIVISCFDTAPLQRIEEQHKAKLHLLGAELMDIKHHQIEEDFPLPFAFVPWRQYGTSSKGNSRNKEIDESLRKETMVGGR